MRTASSLQVCTNGTGCLVGGWVYMTQFDNQAKPDSLVTGQFIFYESVCYIENMV